MQKNIVIIGIAALTLIVGMGVGYLVGKSKVNIATDQNNTMTHQMPGGAMMDSDDMSMSDMMSSMNEALKGKTGDAFDKAFISEMIVHHEGAVEMAKLALTNAKHVEIKNLANAIISAQNTEISQMKEWNKVWYSNVKAK